MSREASLGAKIVEIFQVVEKTPLGELSLLPRLIAGGWGLLPFPQQPHTICQPLALIFSPSGIMLWHFEHSLEQCSFSSVQFCPVSLDAMATAEQG